MTSTTPASSPTVAERYQAAANAVDAAYVRWNAAVSSRSQVSKLTGPSAFYAGKLSSFNKEVLDLGITRMPPSIDIQALVSADTRDNRKVRSEFEDGKESREAPGTGA
jgi:hypothetical protein